MKTVQVILSMEIIEDIRWLCQALQTTPENWMAKVALTGIESDQKDFAQNQYIVDDLKNHFSGYEARLTGSETPSEAVDILLPDNFHSALTRLSYLLNTSPKFWLHDIILWEVKEGLRVYRTAKENELHLFSTSASATGDSEEQITFPVTIGKRQHKRIEWLAHLDNTDVGKLVAVAASTLCNSRLIGLKEQIIQEKKRFTLYDKYDSVLLDG